MADEQIYVPSSRIDEIRKEIYSLRLAEIQQLLYNLKPVPPTRQTYILVTRDPQNPKNRMIQLKQDWSTLQPNEQIGWTCPDGKLEIRFSRNSTPFIGDLWEVPRGGKAYSGLPVVHAAKDQVYQYTILVTTPDGFFIAKEVEFRIAPSATTQGKGIKKEQ